MPQIVELEEKPALGCSAYVIPSQLGSYISESLHRIAAHMRKEGLPVVGGHYTRYYLFSPFLMHVEVSIEIDKRDESLFEELPKHIKLVELPACTAASIVHIGPYEQLPNAYKSLCKWIVSEGFFPGHVCFEQYHTNPEVERDESKYQTTVFWSVSKNFVKARGW